MTSAVKVLVAVGALASGVVGGYAWKDLSEGHTPNLAGFGAAVRGERLPSQDLSPTRSVAEAMSAIDSVFYGTATRQDLTYDAVAGMLASLEDPHTMLMEPALAERFEEKNTGHYVGIGAELSRDPLGARIKRVFKNSPAQGVALKPNDVVTHVDGRSVAGRDLLEVSESIRGESGTTVKLTVFRETSGEPLRFNVRRRAV